MAHLIVLQTGIQDGCAHRHIGVSRCITHETLELAVDDGIQIKINHTPHLAAQAVCHGIGQEANPRTSLAQGRRDGIEVMTQAGDDPHAGDGNAAHGQRVSVDVNRPTRRSLAM